MVGLLTGQLRASKEGATRGRKKKLPLSQRASLPQCRFDHILLGKWARRPARCKGPPLIDPKRNLLMANSGLRDCIQHGLTRAEREHEQNIVRTLVLLLGLLRVFQCNAEQVANI